MCSWMKNIQSKFYIATSEKIKKIKLQMNEHEILLQQTSFVVLASLRFVIHFVIVFHKYK